VRPVYRIVPVRCNVQKEFVYNEAFTVLVGHQYFVDGQICFPPGDDGDDDEVGRVTVYRTVFGPSVSHDGVIYGNNNHNVRLAFRRLTAARGTLDADRNLRNRATTHFSRHLTFIRSIARVYAEAFPEYTGALNEGEEHYQDPHPKKELRVSAWEEMREGDFRGINLNDRLYLTSVLYKMKKDEIAKPGKYPRMIGDLGVGASLQAFRLVDLLKHVMADHPIVYNGCMEMEFCLQPEPSSLSRVFSKLLDPPLQYYFVYFSDDACMSVRTPSGVKVYNLDISSCDASHDVAVFEMIVELTPPDLRAEMRGLVEQCKLPIDIHDLNEPKRFVRLKPTGPRLYSGSTITTFINNCANILIACAICDARATTPDSIAESACDAGYIVTTVECHQPHDIQFLKHSPVYDSDGILRAMLNIGVMLRSSGQCKGDLPGRGDIRTRAMKFQHAYLRGMYPRCSFTLLSMMMQNTLATDEVVTYKNVIDSGDYFTVHDDQVYARYRLTVEEIEELHNTLGMAVFEEEVVTTGIRKILEVDYGLGVVTLD
jgi:hypothetical protein